MYLLNCGCHIRTKKEIGSVDNINCTLPLRTFLKVLSIVILGYHILQKLSSTFFAYEYELVIRLFFINHSLFLSIRVSKICLSSLYLFSFATLLVTISSYAKSKQVKSYKNLLLSFLSRDDSLIV